jgi:hypothetical protein
MLLYHISLLSPTYGSIQFSTGQPQSNLVAHEGKGTDIERERLIEVHVNAFRLLEDRISGI